MVKVEMAPVLRYFGLVCVGLLVVVIAAINLPSLLSPTREQDLVVGVTKFEDVDKALKSLTPDDIKRLSDREWQRLVSEPLDRKALQNLTVLAGLAGDTKRQEELSLVLAQYARRSIASQLVAIQILLGKGDYANGLDHIDGVLRAGGTGDEIIYEGLLRLLAEGKAQTEVVAKLSRNPPWRSTFLQYIINKDTSGGLSYPLLSALRQTSTPPTSEEMRGFMDRLFALKLYDLANFVWLDSLGPEELSKSNLVFDGKLDLIPKNLTFGWNFIRAPNIQTSVNVPPGEGKNTALSVNFFESRDNLYHVFQFVSLGSGQFELSARFLSDNFRSEGGIRWRLRCKNQAESVLGESEVFKEPSAARIWKMRFDVPADDCPLQFFRLESASRAVADQKHSGRAYFDDFEINHVDATSAVQP